MKKNDEAKKNVNNCPCKNCGGESIECKINHYARLISGNNKEFLRQLFTPTQEAFNLLGVENDKVNEFLNRYSDVGFNVCGNSENLRDVLEFVQTYMPQIDNIFRYIKNNRKECKNLYYVKNVYGITSLSFKDWKTGFVLSVNELHRFSNNDEYFYIDQIYKISRDCSDDLCKDVPQRIEDFALQCDKHHCTVQDVLKRFEAFIDKVSWTIVGRKEPCCTPHYSYKDKKITRSVVPYKGVDVLSLNVGDTFEYNHKNFIFIGKKNDKNIAISAEPVCEAPYSEVDKILKENSEYFQKDFSLGKTKGAKVKLFSNAEWKEYSDILRNRIDFNESGSAWSKTKKNGMGYIFELVKGEIKLGRTELNTACAIFPVIEF